MATFREAREALMFAYQDGSIDDTEFPCCTISIPLKISNFLIEVWSLRSGGGGGAGNPSHDTARQSSGEFSQM